MLDKKTFFMAVIFLTSMINPALSSNISCQGELEKYRSPIFYSCQIIATRSGLAEVFYKLPNGQAYSGNAEIPDSILASAKVQNRCPYRVTQLMEEEVFNGETTWEKFKQDIVSGFAEAIPAGVIIVEQKTDASLEAMLFGQYVTFDKNFRKSRSTISAMDNQNSVIYLTLDAETTLTYETYAGAYDFTGSCK